MGYYSSVRGHVREILTRENLQDHLPDAPAKALDLGGGDGRDSEWLANQGFEVTLVDPSEEMIKKAKQRFRDRGEPVAIYQLQPDQVTHELGDQRFDLILSHGVLMYCVEEPTAHIDSISKLAKPGATVSILTKGFGGALDRILSHEDYKAAVRLMGSEKCVNNLGLETWAFKPETVIDMIGKYALELVNWFGVRVATDHDGRDIETIDDEILATILEAERLYSRDHSTRGLGQMLHYIALRT